MKVLFSLFFLCYGFIGFTQSPVSLSINHKVGTENLELNSEFSIANGDLVSLDRCEYYISQIQFIHDGGQVTPASELWILVNAFDEEIFELGDFDVNQLEAIKFNIGVEMPYNTQDLTLWPNNHPLAPQNPSMHWGWASGYRFLAIEGLSGAGEAEFDLEVHALGNANYHEQTVSVSASVVGGDIHIELDADYTQAFTDVATSQGGITHSISGDASNMLVSFRDEVFSAGVVSVIENEFDEISMVIAPNPVVTGENSKLLLDLKNVKIVEVQILDVTGKLVYSELLNGSVSNIDLPLLSSGAYLVNLKDENSILASEKWLVK